MRAGSRIRRNAGSVRSALDRTKQGKSCAIRYDNGMAKFAGLSLQTLNDRLGPPSAKGTRKSSVPGTHALHVLWLCNGANAPACAAFVEARDRPMPADLTPWQQELFENMPLPKNGWTIEPCQLHHGLFARADDR